MTAFLIVLYIGLAIMNGIAIARNNPDAETVNEVDRTKGFFKAIYAHYPFIVDIHTILYGIERCNGLFVHYKRCSGFKSKGIDVVPAA